MAPILCAGVDIGNRLDQLCRGGRSLDQSGIKRFAPQRLCGGTKTHRIHCDAEESKRGAGHDATAVELKKRRGAGQRKISVPTGEFVEAVAVTCLPGRQFDRNDHLVGSERGCHETLAEIADGHSSDAANTRDMYDGIMDGADRRKFSGGIRMRQTAANRTPIASLAMTDMAQRLRHKRTILCDHRRALEIALP